MEIAAIKKKKKQRNPNSATVVKTNMRPRATVYRYQNVVVRA